MAEYYGYAGRVLYVDLTTGSAKAEPLDMKSAEDFLGGWGINNRLAYDLVKPGVDPFSPENPVIVGAGVMGGTLAPAAAKVTLTTKFPIQASPDPKKHFVATSSGGSMGFSLMLKNAGYDHLVITGRARKPSYLKISDEDVLVCDAADLWGNADTYQTRDELKRRHRGAGVISIGKAGENKVRFAHGLCDRSSLGQCGGGAVLGSKNLKAIVAYGTRGIKVADGKRFMKAVDVARKRIMGRKYNVDVTEFEGPAHAFGMSPKYMEAYPNDLYVRTNTDILACTACVSACRASHRVVDGRFAGETFQNTFFLMVPMYGQRLRITDYGESMKVLDAINRAGLDIATTVQMIALVTRLYARGDIGGKETGGLELKRDADSYLALIEKIASREGFGDAMADGWYALKERIGVSPWHHFDSTGIVKGKDAQLEGRGRAFDPVILTEITNPRGGHETLNFPTVHIPDRPLEETREAFRDSMSLSAAEFKRLFTRDGLNVGRTARYVEDGYSVYNSLGFCVSPAIVPTGAINIEVAAEMYSAATGIELTPRQLRKAGERVWNLYKLLNVREGFSRADDAFPPLWLSAADKPTKGGSGELGLSAPFTGKALSRNDLHRMLDDYYEERGWDIEKGVPTKSKLDEMGLGEFAPIVEPIFK